MESSTINSHCFTNHPQKQIRQDEGPNFTWGCMTIVKAELPPGQIMSPVLFKVRKIVQEEKGMIPFYCHVVVVLTRIGPVAQFKGICGLELTL